MLVEMKCNGGPLNGDYRFTESSINDSTDDANLAAVKQMYRMWKGHRGNEEYVNLNHWLNLNHRYRITSRNDDSNTVHIVADYVPGS